MSWARITRTRRDGHPVVVKETDYDARLEADGLASLMAAGAPTPRVIEVDEDQLVMDEVGGEPAWEGLGRALARCHRTTAASFGYDHDNYLGPLPQPNPWTESWSNFYLEQRIRPQLPWLPDALRSRIEGAADEVAELLEHGQPPSLIHGDLWSGNIVAGSWLIDPAVCFADRELDLAFAAVFGGIPAVTWDAYREEWPLDDGWEDRRPALQLYHLLVHVRLFGGGYVPMVEDRLDKLGS